MGLNAESPEGHVSSGDGATFPRTVTYTFQATSPTWVFGSPPDEMFAHGKTAPPTDPEPTVAQVLDGECPCAGCTGEEDDPFEDENGREILDPSDVVVGVACQYIDSGRRVIAATIREVLHPPIGLVNIALIGDGPNRYQAHFVAYCDDLDADGNPIPGTWRWCQ